MSAETATRNAQASETRLNVSITLGDTTAEFSGTPEAVLQSVNSFISRQIPEMDLARKLALNFSVKDLVEKFKDFVRITPEGPRVWNQEEKGGRKMSDKELIGLQLVSQKIASETRDGVQSSVTLASLQESTALNPKSISSRLSEMTKAGYVIRDTNEEEGNETCFRMSTIGIEWLSGLLLEKNKRS
jgi:hypothetical protein